MKIGIRRGSDYLALALGRPEMLKLHVEGELGLPPPVSTKSKPQIMLILGATGFVGMHVLRELLDNTNVIKVYAIIRQGNAISLDARMNSVLKRFRMILPNREKLELLDGDFILPRLGLKEEKWKNLSCDVDVVINAAGSTDHSYTYRYYRKTSVNCYLRLIEFCYQGRLKSLHTVGSIGSEVFRRRVDFYRFGFYHCGYSRMKWILKHLTLILSSQNVPTYLYLAPFVLGSRFTDFKDPGLLYSFWHMVGYALQIGRFWHGGGAFVPAVPADVLARTILRNLFSDQPATIVSPSLKVSNEDFAKSLGLMLTSWSDFRTNLTQRHPLFPIAIRDLSISRLRRQLKHYTFSRSLFPKDFPYILDVISASAHQADDEATWGEYGANFIARCAIANSIYRPAKGV